MINKLLALLILLLISPLLFLVCVIIFLTDGRPVIYKQEKLGLNHKIFYMYKFRTMKNNTPLKPTEEFNNSNKYILPIGSFLRKYSIDELPQIFNVLNGTMNFVGPRPCLANKEEKLKKLREEMGIEKIKPGITGLAQINGRDLNNYQQKVHYDKIYMDNKSAYLNFKIIVVTIFKLLNTKNIKH